MINLRELITFDNQLENSLSSHRRELRSEMKNLTQKLRNSRLVRDESKISSSEEIRHVASNENEFERVNDSLVDNDSNDSSNDDFVSTASFTRSVSRDNSEILRKSVRVLIIASLTVRSLTQSMTERSEEHTSELQ